MKKKREGTNGKDGSRRNINRVEKSTNKHNMSLERIDFQQSYFNSSN